MKKIARSAAVIFACLLALAAPGMVSAQTIGQAGPSDGGASIGDDLDATSTSQTFVTPPGFSDLQQFTVTVESSGAVTPTIREFTGGIFGAPLYTGTAFPAAGGPTLRTVVIPGGLALDPAKTYAINLVGAPGVSGSADVKISGIYAGGVRLFGTAAQATQDLVFSATFSAPAPAAVPTLSEWALVLFGLMLAGGAALYLQRRQLAA